MKLMRGVSKLNPRLDFEVAFRACSLEMQGINLLVDVPFCSELIHTGWGGETFLVPQFSLVCNIVNWPAELFCYFAFRSIKI